MKNTSCSQGKSNFGTFLVILLSFLVLSLLVQSCRLNQNVLAQAASMNQRVQGETKRLSLSDQENADKSLSNLSNQQSAIQNPQSKAEVIQKTAKLQMPFIANNGQTNGRVKFYANTFGGTVFVTKDGEIVYALPMVAHASPLVHYDIDKNETGYTGLTGFSGKEGQCIVHRALCTMYAYCTWNFPVYYSETNSPLKRGTHPLIPSREGIGVCNTTPTTRRDTERCVPTTTVALKEQFVGAKVKTIQGEEKSITKVNYFKGNDSSKWKTDISTYDFVNLGEIYKGIELKLKAYGDNVEKLFYVKPGADPEQIKIKLSGIQPSGNPPPLSPSGRGTGGCPPLAGAGGGLGARGLWVNEHGELEVETELGTVKFTKPVAYQEINGKRVEVEAAYVIRDRETSPVKQTDTDNGHASRTYGFTVASYDRTHDLIIDPLLASTFLGGSSGDYGYSLVLDKSGNVYVTGTAGSTDFPTTNGAYDTSSNGGNVFVSKLNSGLTSLLASTYLGGTDGGSGGRSITLDTSGNVYVTGWTAGSTDFPTTNGAYDTSSNGGGIFVSKFNSELTSLLASTLLGESGYGYSLALDTSGNVYVTGLTDSADFPTTSGAYDTSFNGSQYDVFISKLNSGLTSLLASTYLGGTYNEVGYSLALDTSGNVYVTGYTKSTGFPTTNGAYDTSYNGGDAFVSKLDSGLTSLLASTYLGGSDNVGDECYSLALDTSGNVYVTGMTYSTDFPTTSEAYDTSYNGYGDVFVSKLDGGLTSLLASTFLGGTNGEDYGYYLVLDTSGNVYVTGKTESPDFPTTSGAYYTTRHFSFDVFVSKLNSGLTSLLSSTFLGGSSGDYGYSLALDTSGNVYVVGYAKSTDFPTTSGAYDTSNGGSEVVFVSKLDGNLSASPPTVTTGSATNITTTSATLNGTVNANGLSTTVWFEYDTTSGLYANTSVTYGVGGSDDETVSTSINGLLSGTTYYYRIGARSNSGVTYGNEKPFDTLTDSPPTVITGNATNLSTNSATLGGSVNANGLSTTSWFEYGTTSGSYTSTSSTQSVSGTNATTISINISGLSSGTTYFYRIAAQNSAGTSYGSEKSFKTVTDTTKLPKVTTGSATSVTSNSAKLDGTVNANNLETYVWFEYGTKSGSYGSVSSTQKVTGTSDTTVSISISGLSSATKYYYRIAAQNNSGTSYGSEKSFTTSDTSAPTGSISINGDATYTKSTSVTLTLSATDNAGVTGYYISNSSTKPSASVSGWTSITSTTSYSANVSYTLSSGDGSKTMYVWYKDNSGNVSSSASDSIILDTTAPTITITSPTSEDTYTTSSSVIAIGGSASDSTSGVSSVTWSNDKGGSGTASGTTSWLTSSISLLIGENIITATATDGAGNTGTDTITVTFGSITSTPTPQPTQEPGEKGSISGYVIDKRGNPIESAKIRRKGSNSKVLKKTISDEDGLFEFTDLDADTYIITALKKGYKTVKQMITLEAGEEKDIEIVMKKTTKKGIYSEN